MKRSLILVVVLFPLLGLAALLHTARLQASPPQTGGVTFTVNSTIDATDANPGDGVCETAVGNGICTLRAAVQETNALLGADIIQLPDGVYTITIPGQDFDAAMGDLNITDSLMILGGENTTTIIDGNDIDRIFDIRMAADKEVTLSDLAVVNGSSGFGGGICHCTNDTRLYMNRVILRESHGFGSGGGIYNEGFLGMTGGIIQGNSGGSAGGGIYNFGVAVISGTLVMSNTATSDGLGGGIHNNGILTLTNSTVQGNSVLAGKFGGGSGGGIFSYDNLTVINSTISGNVSTSGGGGMTIVGAGVLLNVTITQNEASVLGGGVHSGGTLTITNSTVFGNSAPNSSGLNIYAGSATLQHTIVAANSPGNDCSGAVLSAGYNLDSGNTCGFNNTGDLINTNPMLGPLQNNGGATMTHALLVGSPAIDAGNNMICPAIDQRGGIRPVDGDGDNDPVCDIGAYEWGALQLTAVPDLITTTQNTPVIIDVLANDIPGDNGDPVLAGVAEPGSGTAVITDTFILYTPDQDFVGTDTFTYTITDGVVTDTAVVTVTVLPLIAPTAVDDAAETNQNEPILIDVLANDLPGSSGDPVLDSVGQPGNGTAVITGSLILYTPTPDFVGTDTFTYTITDGVLTDTAVVTVTVLPVDTQTFIYLPVVLKP